jgi:hypothetical protein
MKYVAKQISDTSAKARAALGLLDTLSTNEKSKTSGLKASTQDDVKAGARVLQ